MDGFHVSHANVTPRTHDPEPYSHRYRGIPPVERYSQKVRPGAITDAPAARLATRGYARVTCLTV
jgi:hypothetical protein